MGSKSAVGEVWVVGGREERVERRDRQVDFVEVRAGRREVREGEVMIWERSIVRRWVGEEEVVVGERTFRDT